MFAFCVSRSLPIHPFYANCCGIGVGPESSRIDWLFGPTDGCNAHGACAPIKRLYPDEWNRLVAIRPDLSTFA